MVLAIMKEVAEAYLGEIVTNAVITVPTCFSNYQCQAIKDAGRNAGLNVMRVISATSIVAHAVYGFNKQRYDNDATRPASNMPA